MNIRCSQIVYLFAIIFLIIGSITLSGCTSSIKNRDLQDVNVKLKWLHQSQFAGNYMAKEKGFYAEEGLNVDLTEFSFENPTIDSVANGSAKFGITGADELILARAKGIPIKAIAVIYKINPVCAYSLKKNGINTPYDFIGRKIGLERGTNVDLLYYSMMNELKINRSTISEITIGYDASELLNGTTDVSTGYIINEPDQVIQAGHEVNIILMADYGANMYSDIIFAREDTINNNPELVEKFLSATLKGWQYSIENENETVDIVLKYAKNSTRRHESYMLDKSIPLIYTSDNPLGWMEKSEWEKVQNILIKGRLLSVPIRIEDAYTMQFLDSIYGIK